MEGSSSPGVVANATGDVEEFDVEPVNAAGRRNLYKAREPIYPKRVHGTFRKTEVVYSVCDPWCLLPVAMGALDKGTSRT